MEPHVQLGGFGFCLTVGLWKGHSTLTENVLESALCKYQAGNHIASPLWLCTGQALTQGVVPKVEIKAIQCWPFPSRLPSLRFINQTASRHGVRSTCSLGFQNCLHFQEWSFSEYYVMICQVPRGEPFLKKVNQFVAIANTLILPLPLKLNNILLCGKHIMNPKLIWWDNNEYIY